MSKAKEELGWLIEHAHSAVSAPLYYCGGMDSPTTAARWSSNSHDAIRFARQVDAERACKAGLDAEAKHRIAEHAWS